MSCEDLIMAFFPCIYFTGFTNPCYYRLDNLNYRGLTDKEKFDAMLKRSDNRNDFYKLLLKLCAICILGNRRLIVENPFSPLHYLHNNFLQEPSFVDNNRQLRGDVFRKPTGYWYFNCEPTIGASYSKPQRTGKVWESKSASKAGLCSEDRSMISPDYARNFICDFILGKEQPHTLPTLF